MKTKTLNYFNFKLNPSNNFNTDQLVLDNLFNLNTDQGYLQSELSIEDAFEVLLNNTDLANTIKNLNQEILAQTTRFIPYQFISDTNNKAFTRFFVLTANYKLYELDYDTNIFLEIYEFSSNPNIIFSEDILYFLESSGNCLIIENINNNLVEYLPQISTFVYSSKNLFFSTLSNPYIVYKSDICKLKDLSQNLNQYDKIKINTEDGEVLNVTKIKDTIFIFTKYSIFKYEEDDDALIKLFDLHMEIYKNSINKLDDEIIFYSSTGLYKFDGNNSDNIVNDYLKIDKNANFICFNQNLYIKPSNCTDFIFKFNFIDNYFYPIKIENIRSFYLIKNNDCYNIYLSVFKDERFFNIALYGNNNYLKPLQRAVFKSTNFKTIYPKIIKDISIKNEGKFTLFIDSETSHSKYEICNNSELKNLGLSGVNFEIKIISYSNFKLNSLSFTIDEVD